MASQPVTTVTQVGGYQYKIYTDEAQEYEDPSHSVFIPMQDIKHVEKTIYKITDKKLMKQIRNLNDYKGITSCGTKKDGIMLNDNMAKFVNKLHSLKMYKDSLYITLTEKIKGYGKIIVKKEEEKNQKIDFSKFE